MTLHEALIGAIVGLSIGAGLSRNWWLIAVDLAVFALIGMGLVYLRFDAWRRWGRG